MMTINEIIRRVNNAMQTANERGYVTEEEMDIIYDFFRRAQAPNAPDQLKGLLGTVALWFSQQGYLPEDVNRAILGSLAPPAGGIPTLPALGQRSNVGRTYSEIMGEAPEQYIGASENLLGRAGHGRATVGAMSAGLEEAAQRAALLGEGEPIGRAEAIVSQLGERSRGRPLMGSAAALGAQTAGLASQFRGVFEPGAPGQELVARYLQQGEAGVPTTSIDQFMQGIEQLTAQLLGFLPERRRQEIINLYRYGLGV